MQKRKWHKWLLSIGVKGLYWISFVLTLCIAANQRADKEWILEHLSWFLSTYNFLNGIAPIAFPLAAVVVSVTTAVEKHFLTNPRFESTVKKLLDDFRNKALPEEDAHIDHRVTLFKYQTWAMRLILKGKLPFFNGCLIPYERAGEYTLNSKSWFLASKENPDCSEGVAGKIFTSLRCEYISGLPAITERANRGSKKKYCEETRTSEQLMEKRLRTKSIFPRSFWGVPVEVDGEIWGVLLIDSRLEEIKDHELIKDIYRPYGACISRLLSRK